MPVHAPPILLDYPLLVGNIRIPGVALLDTGSRTAGFQVDAPGHPDQPEARETVRGRRAGRGPPDRPSSSEPAERLRRASRSLPLPRPLPFSVPRASPPADTGKAPMRVLGVNALLASATRGTVCARRTPGAPPASSRPPCRASTRRPCGSSGTTWRMPRPARSRPRTRAATCPSSGRPSASPASGRDGTAAAARTGPALGVRAGRPAPGPRTVHLGACRRRDGGVLTVGRRRPRPDGRDAVNRPARRGERGRRWP